MRGMKGYGIVWAVLAIVSAFAPTAAAPEVVSVGGSHRSQDRFDELMARHAEALGGREAIASVRSLISTAEIEMIGMGLKGTIVTYQLAGCLRFSEIDLGFFKIKRGFDGERLWMIDQNGKLQFQKDEESVQNQVTSCLIESYGYISPEDDVDVDVLEPDTIDGAYCEVIELAPEGGHRFTLYLDRSTYLIAALTIDSRHGAIDQRYDDYRPVGGVMMPFYMSTTQTAVNRTIETRVKAIEYNPRVEPVVFLPPAAEVKDYRFIGERPSVDAAFLYRNRHIYLAVMLGEDKTAEWFMLDSGAGMTVIDSTIVERLRLKQGGTIPGLGAGGMAEFRLVRIPPFEIKGIVFNEQTGISYPISELTRRFSDIEVGGIMGYDFLSRFVTRIDYADKLITFIEPDSFVAPGTMSGIEAPLMNNIFTTDATIEDSCTGTFLIDTGANHSMLQRGFVERYRLMENRDTLDISILGAGGTETALLARFASIEIGGAVIREPVMALSIAGVGIGAFEGIDGIIGNDLLEKFIVTLDYGNQRLFLERNESFDTPIYRDRSGIQLVRDDSSRVLVYLVIPGTPADRAGIRAGDEILSIDGTAISEFGVLEEINAVFEADEDTERHLVIRRGDETLRVVIHLEKYL